MKIAINVDDYKPSNEDIRTTISAEIEVYERFLKEALIKKAREDRKGGASISTANNVELFHQTIARLHAEMMHWQ